MSFKKQSTMMLAVVVWRACIKPSFGVLMLVSVMLLSGGVARAQIVLDFDTSAPMSTAELPDFFDLFGFDAQFGDSPFWNVDGNTSNPDNNSNALHVTSDGNQLEPWFSRVAILKPSVFAGANVDLSADITWDDAGGDANDNAGLYVRFFGSSDVPLENEFYHVRGTADGGANGVRLHKVQGGVQELLA